MSQMEIVTFGGAASLHKTPDTPFHRCVNYYSINDPLLFLVPSADQALRSGYVANEEFCFLAPRAGDPIADHSLLGATYSQALYWEGQRFQRKYRSLAFRVCRSVILLVLAILNAFIIRLKAVVRATLLPILLLFVHLCARHQRGLSLLLAQSFALSSELYHSISKLVALLSLRFKTGRPEMVPVYQQRS
jgi:hypothetical protein